MSKSDEPRERQQHRSLANTPAATIFAGTIMTLVAVALLFDDDEDDGAPADEDTARVP